MTLSFLIIGSPGRLRDALRAILHSIVNAAEIDTADDFETGFALAAEKLPTVVIIDGSEFLDSDCTLMKKLLAHQESSRCLLIADTLERMMRARQAGADAVLQQGFTIDTLRATLLALNVLPEAGDKDSRPVAVKPKPRAVPLAQKI